MKSSTAELKNYLHKLIVETDDESILSKVQTYFNSLKNKNQDWWETISDSEKEAINSGLHQLDNGQGISNQSVKQKVDQLLGRK